MQFDIFEHSRDIMLKNDVIGALECRDATGARSNRAALYREYPDSLCMQDLDRMIEALEKSRSRIQTHQNLNTTRQWLADSVEHGYWETEQGKCGSPRYGKTWLPVRRRCRSIRTPHSIMVHRFGCV